MKIGMKRCSCFILLFCMIVKILAINQVEFISNVHRKCIEIEELMNGFPITRSKAEFVMFYTNEIERHAITASCLNRLYGKIYGITMNLIDPSKVTKDFEFGDVRWNKVKILYDLLTKKDEKIDYYIWLDADLIFSDFSFDITTIYSENPTFDVLISKEINPANGIANTGSMIVKNTDWSREFFKKWWTEYDHGSAMDQHSFEDLYRKTLHAREHIALLPENKMNSIFPGLWTFCDTDPILHLAGESNFIREEIFELALNQLYEQVTNKISTNLKLISRAALDSIDYLGIHLKEWNQIISDINQILSLTPQSQIVELSVLQQMRYRIREAQQSFNKFSKDFILEIEQQKDHTALSDEIFQKSIVALRLVYGLSCRVLLAIHRTPEKAIPAILIPYYQNTIDTGFELLVIENSADNYLLLLRELEQLVVRLTPFTHPNDHKILLYYSFKLAQFEGFYHENPSRMLSSNKNENKQEAEKKTLSSYSNAFNVWFQLANNYNYFGSGNSLLSSYREGVKLLKKLLFLQCWHYERQDLENKQSLPLNIHYLSLAYNATCILFHLVKESPSYLREPLRNLHGCEAKSNNEISFASLASTSKISPFPFESLSNYTQSEFIEIFMLFANCYDSEEMKDIPAFTEWKRTIFPTMTFSTNSLESYYPFFDVITPSMMKYLLPSVQNYFEASNNAMTGSNEHDQTKISVSDPMDPQSPPSKLTTKRLKKVKKRPSSSSTSH